MTKIVCVECRFRDWDEYGCIENQPPEQVCLFCCGCPDHQEWWGTKCCGHDYYDKACTHCDGLCNCWELV